jgi:Transposase DDE domain
LSGKLSGWQEARVGERQRKQDRITEADVSGLKYFDRLAPLLARLRDVGCERDRAGNRQLHFDQYCMLVLLYLFNPIVTSLRGLQQASELAKVQKRLGCSRAALGSLSESVTVFDPQRLQEIVLELGAELKPLGRDPRLKDVPGALAAVDGTLLAALPRLMQASLLKRTTGSGLVKWRLHTHFEVDRGVPTRIEVTPDGGGAHDERAVLERTVQADHTYILDRGYAKFALFNAIVAAGSSYVCRLRDNSDYRVLESRPLTDADRALNVVGDARVEIGLHGKPEARLDHQVRLITVRINPHTSRGKYRGGSTGPASDGLLRICTNLLDVPAEAIALIYLYRWTIEIFFRFFKHVLGCRHLLSHSQKGIEIQTYCAIIACMLISLWTGRKPTLRTYEMICFYLAGMASAEELLAHLAKLARQDEPTNIS